MSAKLLVEQGLHSGAKFGFDESPLVIGSDAECNIELSDPGVIAKHAIVEETRGTWRLRALDATTPIEAEGRMLMELRLDHGTVFSLGQAQLRFLSSTTSSGTSEAEAMSEQDQDRLVAELSSAYQSVLQEVSKVIIGQKSVLNQILVALFARGHCLLVGVPGLAKTLMVRALADALDLGSRRIQFTPDLMPSDITGTDILEESVETGRRHFRFNRGPLFTNMLLADEINRTPPKTQAALLEAMQEQRVTASGLTYDLPQPFFVLATQNPIELEGTYPLPEAQLDRFMFSVQVDYPSENEEAEIINETTRDRAFEVSRVLDAGKILEFQRLVRSVPVSPHVARYAAALTRASRPGTDGAPEGVTRWLRWGAGPRAGQYLLLAAKSHVLLQGRFNVSCKDVRQYALPVLCHRIFRNFAAASEGITTDEIVRQIIDTVKEPEY